MAQTEEMLQTWLQNPAVGKLIGAAVAVVLIVIAVRLINRFMGVRIENAQARYRLRKGIVFLGYVFGILFLGAIYNDQLGQFTVAFGVAGAGIAFALQELIVSVAGWLTLSVGGIYHPGDRIQLGGVRGDVMDIGVLRTTLMECGEWVNGDLYNGRIVRMANSYVFKEPVYNYSADFPFLWDEIMIPIKYGSDYVLARQIFEQVAEELVGEYSRTAEEAWKRVVTKYMIEHAKVRPVVTVAANENWIEFTLRYVVDYKQRRSTKNALFLGILGAIDKTSDKVRNRSLHFKH